MKKITDKTVVITGAGSGIGLALALGFLGEGARVIGGDISDTGLSVIAAHGGLGIRCDVSREEDVRHLADVALAETGRIDILFNNAGIDGRFRIEDAVPGAFERVVQVHLFGTFYGLRTVMPVMRAQNYGRIVNVLSRAAEMRAPGWAPYGSAKAAIFALTRFAAAEGKDANILVNGMIPGPTQSGMNQGPGLQQPEKVFPGALWLATLPDDGPTGEVFWKERAYAMFGKC